MALLLTAFAERDHESVQVHITSGRVETANAVISFRETRTLQGDESIAAHVHDWKEGGRNIITQS